MIRSKAISAHVYTSVEVDFENVANARKAEGKAFKEKEGFSLTYLPFIVRALSEALPDFPNVNASVDGDNLVVHPDFHVGIAVDLDFKGLLVPAVRNAQGKKLRLIAQEIRDLAVRAKSKQLRPDEVIGSTFTISNTYRYPRMKSGSFSLSTTRDANRHSRKKSLSTNGTVRSKAPSTVRQSRTGRIPPPSAPLPSP